jgi:hypothetical protein
VCAAVDDESSAVTTGKIFIAEIGSSWETLVSRYAVPCDMDSSTDDSMSTKFQACEGPTSLRTL